MKFKLQRKKQIYKPALNKSNWEEQEIENYNNRTKRNLNYSETTDTNQKWENLKHTMKTAAKDTLGELKQQPIKPWISEKTLIVIGQRRKHKHDKNKSEYN